MRDLVSIIVPVYNVADYLPRCVKSLTEQTHQNIEIILVDDGSTDGSGEICDRWAERDDRIRVFHKENGGMSDARNYGLSRAGGAYISFVDSDDWCDRRFIEVLLRTLRETDCELVECDYVTTWDDQTIICDDQNVFPYEIYTDRDCFRQFLTETFFVSVWNKLYRRDLVDNVPFEFGAYHEDEMWTCQVFGRARRICRLHYTGYCYFQREGSVVHSRPTYKRLSDAFRAGRERIGYIEQNFPELASIGYSKVLYTCISVYATARGSDFGKKAVLQREVAAYARSMLRKYLKEGRYQGEMWRFCFFALFPKLYCRLLC